MRVHADCAGLGAQGQRGAAPSGSGWTHRSSHPRSWRLDKVGDIEAQQQALSLAGRSGDLAGGVRHGTSAMGRLAGAVSGEQHTVPNKSNVKREGGDGQQTAWPPPSPRRIMQGVETLTKEDTEHGTP